MAGDGGSVFEAIKARWQRPLNARPIPDRRLQRTDRQHIPVLVRIDWDRDGEQWLEAEAIDWVGRDVLVWFERELRLQTHAVWVDAGDVRRR